MTTASVASITVICYIVAELIKVSKLDNKWIPVIVGVFGGILGIIGVYIMPGFPAADPFNGASVGILSGLASTGANQIYKQLGNDDFDINDFDDYDEGDEDDEK